MIIAVSIGCVAVSRDVGNANADMRPSTCRVGRFELASELVGFVEECGGLRVTSAAGILPLVSFKQCYEGLVCLTKVPENCVYCDSSCWQIVILQKSTDAFNVVL